MQEIKSDGELGFWEELDLGKMRDKLNDGSATGYNVRKMTADVMAHKNASLQTRRNANKRARKARAKNRRK